MIAIVGHRPNRLLVDSKRIRARIEVVLRCAARPSEHVPCSSGDRIALSSLAEGSDRLFAVAALGLGYRLKVLLPFKSADYEKTFSDQSALAEYRGLLAAANGICELPGTLDDTKSAYGAVGHATVDAAHIILAVWDGKPAAGRGGTPEIMDYALSQGKSVIWIDAARDRPPLLLKWPSAGGLRPVSLPKLAQRATHLTASRLVALVRHHAVC